MKTLIVSRTGFHYEELASEQGRVYYAPVPRYRVQVALDINDVLLRIEAPTYMDFKPDPDDAMTMANNFLPVLNSNHPKVNLRSVSHMLFHLSMHHGILQDNRDQFAVEYDIVNQNMNDIGAAISDKYDPKFMQNVQDAARAALEDWYLEDKKLENDPKYRAQQMKIMNSIFRNR